MIEFLHLLAAVDLAGAVICVAYALYPTIKRSNHQTTQPRYNRPFRCSPDQGFPCDNPQGCGGPFCKAVKP